MKIKTLAIVAVAVICFVTSPVASAHHGAAGYDNTKMTILQATITAFVWMNPHCEVRFDAIDDKGDVQHWTIEAPPPTMLVERGWNKNSLKPGAVLTLHLNRAKNGSPTGILRKVVLPHGEDLWAYPPPEVLEELTTRPKSLQ